MDKSPWLAFVLTLIFGPLGLLYVAVVPALILLVISVTGYFTFGVTTLLAWIVSIVWGSVVASRRHHEFLSWRASTGDQGIPRPGRHEAAGLAYFPSQNAPLPPAGWYPDAVDSTRVRWWDGSQWSDDVRSADSYLPPRRRQAMRRSRPPTVSAGQAPPSEWG